MPPRPSKTPSLLLTLLGLVAVLVLVAYLQGPPSSAPESHTVQFPIDPGGALGADAGAAREDAPASRQKAPASRSKAESSPLQVDIELAAGEFDILPARLGKSISVEAEYDEALHHMEHEFSRDPLGGDSFRLTFENRGSWQHLRRALHELGRHMESDRSRRRRRGDDFGDTRVRVELPTGVPMDLVLKVGKGKAHVDLSGLSLRRLTLEHAMGEAQLVFEELNPIEMESLELRGKMGDLRVSGLGYTRTRALDFSGRMGSFELDLDGPWNDDVQGSVRVSMGDAVVRVPQDLRLQMSSRGVIMGGLHTPRSSSRRTSERRDPGATLTLQTSVRFGNLSIR